MLTTVSSQQKRCCAGRQPQGGNHMQIVKRKRVIALVLAACMLMGISLTASARSYSFKIPYPFQGSKQKTEACLKETNATPYVKPSVNTISTCYYLAPDGNSEIPATNIITTNNTSKQEFTWKNSYGGKGTSYMLCAYPGIMTNYDAYNVRGEWSE